MPTTERARQTIDMARASLDKARSQIVDRTTERASQVSRLAKRAGQAAAPQIKEATDRLVQAVDTVRKVDVGELKTSAESLLRRHRGLLAGLAGVGIGVLIGRRRTRS